MFKNLLSVSYWFNLIPGPLGKNGETAFVALIVLFLVVSVLTILLKKKGSIYKKTFTRLYNFSISNFIIAIILLFFRYEVVPFLSARFWLGLWFISTIIWLYVISLPIKDLKERKEEEKRKKEIDKYIP